MFFNNLATLFPKIARKNLLTRNSKLLHISSCLAKSPTPENTDEPVQFSSSKAAQWSVKNTYGQPLDQRTNPPVSQPYVVAISVLVFAIYFFALREENDLDEKLYQPLSVHGIKWQ